MTADTVDPVIHDPARLRIVATLAEVPESDALWSNRLQQMLKLSPGSLITHLQDLEDAGYLARANTGNGGAQTAVALTHQGREALDRYTAMLRHLLAGPHRLHRMAQAPQLRAGDADRDAAAAALSEHFAHGRLTLDELNERLTAALAATTHGELSKAIADLPEVTAVSVQVSFSRSKRRRPGHPPRPVPGPETRLHQRGRTQAGSS